MKLRVCASMAALLLTAALPVSAQTDNTFAIGANFSMRAASDPSAHGTNDIGLLWRFGHSDTGWGWQWGLNWYATDIDQNIGGANVELGELHVRPFMAGYGYTRVIGRAALTADLIGGFALNSFVLTPAATDAYHDRLGAGSVRGDAQRLAVVAKPEVSMWYDINKKIGLNVSVGYVIARPRLTIKSTIGDDVRPVRADIFQVKAGLAYSIF